MPGPVLDSQDIAVTEVDLVFTGLKSGWREQILNEET